MVGIIQKQLACLEDLNLGKAIPFSQRRGNNFYTVTPIDLVDAKRYLALQLNLLPSQVAYADPGTSLDGIAAIINYDTQEYFKAPENLPIGTTIVSLVNDQLTTTAGTYTVYLTGGAGGVIIQATPPARVRQGLKWVRCTDMEEFVWYQDENGDGAWVEANPSMGAKYDEKYRIETDVIEVATGAFPSGSKLVLRDRGYGKFDVVSGGTANGFDVLDAGGGNTAVLVELGYEVLTTAQRISFVSPVNGWKLFDSDLGKPLWYFNGWVDANGTTV